MYIWPAANIEAAAAISVADTDVLLLAVLYSIIRPLNHALAWEYQWHQSAALVKYSSDVYLLCWLWPSTFSLAHSLVRSLSLSFSPIAALSLSDSLLRHGHIGFDDIYA